MKSIVISINPEHALNILKGDKTRELRKSIPKGFIGWVYGYVTKGKPYLYNAFGRLGLSNIIHNELDFLNGTIPFRFWFDEYEILETTKTIQKISETEVTFADGKTHRQTIRMVKDVNYTNAKGSCLTDEQLKNYGKGKDLYAWHIKKLDIFDRPMELREFYNYKNYINSIGNVSISAQKECGIKGNLDETKESLECYRYTYNHMMKSTYGVTLKRPPQSYQYVWVKGE